jgi:hypothetical protein
MRIIELAIELNITLYACLMLRHSLQVLLYEEGWDEHLKIPQTYSENADIDCLVYKLTYSENADIKQHM